MTALNAIEYFEKFLILNVYGKHTDKYINKLDMSNKLKNTDLVFQKIPASHSVQLIRCHFLCSFDSCHLLHDLFQN